MVPRSPVDFGIFLAVRVFRVGGSGYIEGMPNTPPPETFVLIPGRTSRQGTTLNEGKFTPGYVEETGTLMFRFKSDGIIDPNPIARFPTLAPDTHTPVVVGNRLFGIGKYLHCVDLKVNLKPVWRSDDDLFNYYASIIAEKESLWGKVTARCEYVLHSVEFDNVPESQFDVKLPAGTSVSDLVRQFQYTVAANDAAAIKASPVMVRRIGSSGGIVWMILGALYPAPSRQLQCPGLGKTRVTLYNAHLIVRHASGETERRMLASAAEYCEVLRETFGLELSE